MWQQFFCCTKALHFMQSYNGIRTTELLSPINVQCRLQHHVRKSCILFARDRLRLRDFSWHLSWQDVALVSLYCNFVSCCMVSVTQLSCGHSNLRSDSTELTEDIRML